MFFGRERELKLLMGQLNKKTARLIVIRGRRRIGKSRLIEEFTKQAGIHTLSFSGILPVRETTAQSQREEFVHQMEIAGIPGVGADDWGKIFWQLHQHTQQGKVIVVLDEISWMGTKDFDFLGKLKNAWDLYFSKNPDLVLVLCGSISSWVEEKILNNPAFLGRISLKIKLDELSLITCNQFWGPYSDRISSYDKLKILSVTGGIPRYLEEIQPKVSAEENIRQLCFEKEGFLFDEFDQIFSDLFRGRKTTYEKIVQGIISGKFELNAIYKGLGVKKSGKISKYLDELILSGFVAKDYTWNIENGQKSKLSHYRVRDNYLRFYLKWILPNKSRIERDEFTERSLSTLKGWDTIMGLQFENLVLHNRRLIQNLLSLQPSEIVANNPYFQRKTARQEGCQIDYMIQTVHHFIYLCEIKFSRKPIDKSILNEVQQKMDRLRTPKYFSKLPVLIHVCGVDPDVEESGFFSQIIDFASLIDD